MLQSPYERLGGEAGIRRLVDCFYTLMDELPEAADIRAMHGDDLSAIRQKLFEYLSGWLGGPDLYQQRHGGVCLTGAHRPFPIGQRERDQWLLCMERALVQTGADDETIALLQQPFFRIADALRNRDDEKPAAQAGGV